MTDTLFRNVRFLDLNLPDGMTTACDVRISTGRIAEIGIEIAANEADEVIDGAGNLLMPGLINGHFHSAVNHMKGRLPSLPLENNKVATSSA